MPVIRPMGQGKPKAKLREVLIERLVAELMGEPTRDGPIIFERRSARGEIDPLVIWDAWKPVAPQDRTAIIRAAYKKHFNELSNAVYLIDPKRTDQGLDIPRVAEIAIGATWEEALAEGLLPYSIRPTREPENADRYVLCQLMRESGGVETDDGIELRLPDTELATEALARLMQTLPEYGWEIVEEAGVSYD